MHSCNLFFLHERIRCVSSDVMLTKNPSHIVHRCNLFVFHGQIQYVSSKFVQYQNPCHILHSSSSSVLDDVRLLYVFKENFCFEFLSAMVTFKFLFFIRHFCRCCSRKLKSTLFQNQHRHTFSSYFPPKILYYHDFDCQNVFR